MLCKVGFSVQQMWQSSPYSHRGWKPYCRVPSALLFTSLGRSEIEVPIENLPRFSAFLRLPFWRRTGALVLVILPK